MYGKGAYFAKDASYSDRYSNPRVVLGAGPSFFPPGAPSRSGFNFGWEQGPASPNEVNWMFMARIIVGRTCKGELGKVWLYVFMYRACEHFLLLIVSTGMSDFNL